MTLAELESALVGGRPGYKVVVEIQHGDHEPELIDDVGAYYGITDVRWLHGDNTVVIVVSSSEGF